MLFNITDCKYFKDRRQAGMKNRIECERSEATLAQIFFSLAFLETPCKCFVMIPKHKGGQSRLCYRLLSTRLNTVQDG